MTVQRRTRTALAVALLGVAQLALAADARAADPATYTIAPAATDPGIVDTVPTRGNNLVWLPAQERRVGKLLVFLPLGGMVNIPTEFEEFGSEGRRLGYHTIVLAYRNEAPVAFAPPVGCGNGELAATAPANCAIDVRMEILDGKPKSTVVDVDESGSIKNRLNKQLQYLATSPAHDGEEWSQFLDPGGAPIWSEIVIAGASFGAGQAALIAELHAVHRAALFTGWTDARHGWVGLGATPSARYSALIHPREQFFTRTCFAYLELELAASCPLADFPTLPVSAANPALVEHRPLPFGTRQLVFNLEPTNQPPIADPWHPSAVRDGYLPKNEDGTIPSQKLVNAWRSVLGDADADGYLDPEAGLEHADNCPQANPDQADTDRDGTGDACDPTPQGTTAPNLTVPGQTVVDATGPAGTPVSYTATAIDDIDSAPVIVCTPPSGGVFAIGDTTVTCTATDAAGNAASANFAITVLGAKEQLENLITEVIDATTLAPAVKAQLIATLRSVVAGVDPGRPLQRKIACLTLRAFTSVVGYLAPAARAAEWTADANRIRAVLAC